MEINFIFAIAVLVMSVVVHEVSHGFIANYLGDPTAKYAGRLTLNPLKHLDLFGSVLVPFLLVITNSPFLIGWAKPVPYNPYNLKNQKWGPAIVGAAGPLSNIFFVIIFSILIYFVPVADMLKEQAVLSVLFPDLRASLDFSNILVSLIFSSSLIIWINLILAVFNLLPIPPLDGSKVLFALLPYKWNNVQFFLERYGFFILLIFIIFLWRAILPVVFLLFRIVTGFGL
ncbi:MAG: hypothetical protein A2909_02630 [Candidatus Tagabacteria bacterium RIFCSPLOWO2_01_FULL_39_11]|uniref:Peptidase M50 domain-containing protein n=1 Tax=Candidatus Tagabacteria bacterium RIFCSPLOWO2_01_FULL_39_11 TaxID=1802295 RepID=A0A1G2LRB0_9BACT|nr:MAG: hypothetical protein A2909_02630 [Candidatus Tagabacteria bacterium RIFCSPLOWO2_01_FULL_39_11]